MELQDILSVVNSKLNQDPEYSSPKDLTNCRLAKNYGGFAKFYKPQNMNVIVIAFVIHVLDQVQTDAKTYIDNLMNAEEYDFQNLLDRGFYKLTYIPITVENEHELKKRIIELNCSEPKIIDENDGKELKTMLKANLVVVK